MRERTERKENFLRKLLAKGQHAEEMKKAGLQNPVLTPIKLRAGLTGSTYKGTIGRVSKHDLSRLIEKLAPTVV